MNNQADGSHGQRRSLRDDAAPGRLAVGQRESQVGVLNSFFFTFSPFHFYFSRVSGYTMLTMKMLAARMMRFISRPMRMKSLKR